MENAVTSGQQLEARTSNRGAFVTLVDGHACRVDIPAKINLWLEVIQKRPDGYHDLSSLMLPVRVFDRLDLAWRAERGIRLECAQAGIPLDGANLAWRAAERFMEATGLRGGVQIRLCKGIPMGAGMGGGSADAAAVLLGLNAIHGDVVELSRLHELARTLGADVPFFLYGEPALATGIGEKLQFVTGVPDYPLVLLKPPLSVSTQWVYSSLKLTRGESQIKIHSFLLHAWNVAPVMQNDLESVTVSEYPVLARMKAWLLEQGALGALMSGSGPTVFGVFPDGYPVAAVAARACEAWSDCWVTATAVGVEPAVESSKRP